MSPDGSLLAYTERTPERLVWHLLPLTGSPAPKEVNAGVFSPDGKFVVIVTGGSAFGDVFVGRVAGGPLVQVSNAGGNQPIWSRNGREIFYRSPQQVMAVEVGGDPSRPGAPRVLFPDPYARLGGLGLQRHANYDVHPDGRFVFIEGVEDNERTAINVVVNWWGNHGRR